MPRRKTRAQAAVLQILRATPGALSHEDISTRLEEPLDRVTIYRVLNRFVDDGVAHRIVADDGKQYFAGCAEGCSHGRADHGHVHFRCLECDRVECLDSPANFKLPSGYRAENFNIMVSGTCGSCAAAA